MLCIEHTGFKSFSYDDLEGAIHVQLDHGEQRPKLGESELLYIHVQWLGDGGFLGLHRDIQTCRIQNPLRIYTLRLCMFWL